MKAMALAHALVVVAAVVVCCCSSGIVSVVRAETACSSLGVINQATCDSFCGDATGAFDAGSGCDCTSGQLTMTVCVVVESAELPACPSIGVYSTTTCEQRCGVPMSSVNATYVDNACSCFTDSSEVICQTLVNTPSYYKPTSYMEYIRAFNGTDRVVGLEPSEECRPIIIENFSRDLFNCKEEIAALSSFDENSNFTQEALDAVCASDCVRLGAQIAQTLNEQGCLHFNDSGVFDFEQMIGLRTTELQNYCFSHRGRYCLHALPTLLEVSFVEATLASCDDLRLYGNCLGTILDQSLQRTTPFDIIPVEDLSDVRFNAIKNCLRNNVDITEGITNTVSDYSLTTSSASTLSLSLSALVFALITAVYFS